MLLRHTATAEQTQRITRKRTYSGHGFGPCSFECIGPFRPGPSAFECIGLGIGLGLGVSGVSAAGAASPQSILSGIPMAWIVDMAQPGTLVSGKVHTVPDQSGNGRDFNALGADLTYSATGGPNSQPYCQSNGTNNYLKNAVYALPAPGTTPVFHYGIYRVDAWVANGAFHCGNIGTVLTITGSGTTPKYKAFNGTNSSDLSISIGSWLRVYCQFNNSASVDRLRIGSADTSTGTSFGNTAPTAGVFLLVGTAYSRMSLCYAFDALGVPSTGQKTSLDAWATTRFGAIGF